MDTYSIKAASYAAFEHVSRDGQLLLILDGFDEISIAGVEGAGPEDVKAAVKAALAKPSPDRLLLIAQAYRHGLTTAEIHTACHYESWFIERIGEILNFQSSDFEERP